MSTRWFCVRLALYMIYVSVCVLPQNCQFSYQILNRLHVRLYNVYIICCHYVTETEVAHTETELLSVSAGFIGTTFLHYRILNRCLTKLNMVDLCFCQCTNLR